jgi:hypothetical protein
MKTLLDPGFWDDADFDDVEDIITLAVYAYLMTNPKQNIIGVYKFSARRSVTSLRLDKNRIIQYLDQLQSLEHPKVMYCQDSKWLWIIGSFKRNMSLVRNDNTAKHVTKTIKEIKDSDFPFWKEFSKKYEEEIKLVNNRLLTKQDKGKDKDKGKNKDKIDSETLIPDAFNYLPENMRTNKFKDSLKAWIRYLVIEKEKPKTSKSIERIIDKCSEWGPELSVKAIQNS